MQLLKWPARVRHILTIVAREGWPGVIDGVRNQLWKRGEIGRRILYAWWIARHEPSRAELQTLRQQAQRFAHRPLMTIVTVVDDADPSHLSRCIQSVVDQVYENWELCAIAGTGDGQSAEVLASWMARDPRIRRVSASNVSGVAARLNAARAVVTGEWITVVHPEDTIAPTALSECVSALNAEPGLDWLYSDEDVLSEHGRRVDPSFKPEWSPDTLLATNYVGKLVFARRQVIDEIGWFREEYEGGHAYDFVLRVGQKSSKVRRIPKVLYHHRATSQSRASGDEMALAAAAEKRALADRVRRSGLDADVLDGLFEGSYRVRYRVRSLERVSIIIPTKDRVALLRTCVSSVLARTSHRAFQIVIVDNGSQDEETHRFFDEMQTQPQVQILRDDRPFNFSALNNLAAHASDAQHLLFLNNDTEVINPDWLTAMLEYSQRRDVGAVGSRLYYRDGTIQHAGVILGLGGVTPGLGAPIANHWHRHYRASSAGYLGRIKIPQNLSAVTGACLMIRRSVFDEVGGFDEALLHAFNDIDLCLKVRDKGYLVVYTPYAELYHHESASRGSEDTPERHARFAREIAIMRTRWGPILEAGDPYYNPNLTRRSLDIGVGL